MKDLNYKYYHTKIIYKPTIYIWCNKLIFISLMYTRKHITCLCTHSLSGYKVYDERKVLNNDGPQFYQYQQNEQSSLLPHTIEHKETMTMTLENQLVPFLV
jgi:hypothetical protein